MDAPGNLQTAVPPSLAARLREAAGQIDLSSKIAIACVFFGWFLLDTLVVILGSLQHGVRFFDISEVIANPSRMFFGLQGSLHRMFFIPLCVVCLYAPVLPHLRRIRLLWLSYAAPLALMVICGALLFSRTSREFIAAPSNAGAPRRRSRGAPCLDRSRRLLGAGRQHGAGAARRPPTSQNA
jgi:hypothetical protein